MITLAEVASSGAAFALLATCLWLGREMAALRERLEELVERSRRQPTAPEDERTGRPPPRMVGALYQQERSGVLSELGDLPGAPAMVAAAALLVLAVALSVSGRGRNPAPEPTASRQELAALRGTLDSMSRAVHQLADSSRTGPVSSPARAAAPRPTALAPAPAIPPAPTIESIQPAEKP